MDNTELNLEYKVPFVFVDGQAIATRDNGMVDIMFWQSRKQTPKTIEADVVAAIRYVSIEDLKTLQKAIGDAIKKHESREP